MSYYKHRRYGKEAVWFQFNRNFGEDLEQAFQKAINYVRSIDFTNVSEDKITDHRKLMTLAYCKNELFPEMEEIIKKHTNLNVLEIVGIPKMCGVFAVDMSLDDPKAVKYLLEKSTGTSTGTQPKNIGQSAEEMLSLHENLDVEKGRLKSAVFGKNGTREIDTVLFMDVPMAFLLHDNIPEKISEPLTANELAGIYLHEVGHVLTLLELTKNSYQSFSQTKSHLLDLKKLGAIELEEYVNVYNAKLRPELKKLVDAKKVSSKVLDAGDALVESTIEYQQMNQKYFTAVFEVIGSILKLLIFTFFFGLCRYFVTDGVNTIVQGWRHFFTTKPGEKGKTTDQSMSYNVYYHAERMADEFASRMGYGGGLASGLAKITTISKYLNAPAIVNEVESPFLRQSTIYFGYLKVITSLYDILRLTSDSLSKDLFPGENAYAEDVERLQQILNQTAAIFKKDLPDHVSNHYLREMAKIKRSLADIRKSFGQRASDWVWTYILDIPTILKRIFQLDDASEMTEYFNKLDAIINNELYAHATALRQLSR